MEENKGEMVMYVKILSFLQAVEFQVLYRNTAHHLHKFKDVTRSQD